MNRNLTVCNILITHGILKTAINVCREVNEMREERLRRRECDKRRRERETNEERHATFALALAYHILVMELYIDWLGKE